ncbi:MAG: biopolymer transporter ExbD [Pseudomonadota bacterium]
MIKFSNHTQKKEKDSTVALINIVFLMLVFFLIAGTIVPPMDSEVTPILSQEEQNAELENTFSIRADGATFYQGNASSPEDFMTSVLQAAKSEKPLVRVLADKELSAVTLVEIINKLQAAGASSIRIITERKES